MDQAKQPIAQAEPLQDSHYTNQIHIYLHSQKLNLTSNKANTTPIPKRATILNRFLGRKGLLLVKAKGTAMPIMKRKDGKMRSASVNPFQSGWSIHQGPSIRLSTMSIPMMVSPLWTSSDTSLSFFSGGEVAGQRADVWASGSGFEIRAYEFEFQVKRLSLSFNIFQCCGSFQYNFIRLELLTIHHNKQQSCKCKFIDCPQMHQFQPHSPKLKTKTQMKFFTFKSQTLNPEATQRPTPNEQDDYKFLTLTASRAKRKLQQTAATKYRFSVSSISARQKSTSSFQPTDTISSMVRKRHSVQQKTKNISNTYAYLSHKYALQYKKKQQQKQMQSRLCQTINLNKSQKSLFESTIMQNNQKSYLNKLKSKSLIVDHKKSLHKVIQTTLLQKSRAGQIGRNESAAIDREVELIKKQWKQKNKEAAEKGKLAEEELHKQKLQREIEKKKIAEQNYKRKWMQEFITKQKIERDNLIRTRKLSKKIRHLLEQTQGLIG